MRLISDDGATAVVPDSTTDSTITASAIATASAPAPAPAPAPASIAAESTTGDAAPPLPNYDELSVASLRARLRSLDVTQVRRLADYERAHAERADVINMFERRISKLEAGAKLEADAELEAGA